MTDLADALADLDARFVRQAGDRRIPGLAWGVVRGGELVHTGGSGTVSAESPTEPGADHVFRIASMTKSFTAATVLLLRDEGRLGLDDAVAQHLPYLAGWRPYADDAAPVTIRQLLTMSAGLATDDPWGDRQQGLPLDAFERLLAEGPSFVLPPGVAFEYSNLGYGILGRVITAVVGREYREVVRERLLRPLGMTSSGYLEEEVPADRLMHGYVRHGDDLVREGRDGYGALAAMGGIFSTVRDLAIWVGGFLDAYPARSGPEGGHPLRRASRREMQQGQRPSGVSVPAHAPDESPRTVVRAYGLGLETAFDLELGTFVSHSGGYPGFGSHMAWHPSSGLGVVALGSLRYAPARSVADEALRALVEADLVPRRSVVAADATQHAVDEVNALLARWDDARADALFAMNMDLDVPRDQRRDAVGKAVDAVGGRLRDEPGRAAVSQTPAERTWWRRGERGWLRVQVRLTPEPRPSVQTLVVEAVVDPSPVLVAAGAAVLRWAVEAVPPAGVAVDEAFDAARLRRAGAAATARFGRLELGLPKAGDGTSAATWALLTERGGQAELRIALHPDTGALREAALLVSERSVPPEGW